MYDLDLLVRPYLQKSLGEVSPLELSELADQYPYFAPLQLALLKKWKDDNHPEYDKQLQKAVLYYYDPIQFEAFVNSHKFITDSLLPEAEIASEPIINNIPPAPASEEDIALVEKAQITEPTIPEENIASTPKEDTSRSEPIISQTPEEDSKDIKPDEKTEDIITNDEAQNIYPDTVLNVVPGKDEEIEEPTPVPTEIITPAEPLAAIPFPLPAEPKDTALAFEPYHTVDYFASQGIKLSQEEVANDRMGKQLKSFTAWLKTMKRLPAPELTNTLDNTNEHKVQNLAEHSLDNTDVVTEAMAEVWAKQGNRAKAIEVYNKLSLQNPSKKAYFATKIENLKIA